MVKSFFVIILAAMVSLSGTVNFPDENGFLQGGKIHTNMNSCSDEGLVDLGALNGTVNRLAVPGLTAS